ncbi:MAG: hypothetical protein PHI11_02665 [Gallionella sp.]|nr:hypothetical protein [Gallionella sp.]
MGRVLFCVLIFVQVSFAMADQQNSVTSTTLNECNASMSDKRLDPLRGYIYFSEHNGLKPMDQLNRYPTEKEKKALIIFYDLKMQCMANILANIRALEPDFNSVPDLYSPLLAKLRDGQITYADLKEWQDRKRAELKDKKLSCLLESPDDVAGIEIQYSFNQSLNSLSASRGGAPENIEISDTEITYRTSKNWKVSISRNTGHLTIMNAGTVIVGACSSIAERKF